MYYPRRLPGGGVQSPRRSLVRCLAFGALIMPLAATVLAFISMPASAQTYAGKIGVEVDCRGDGPFVNINTDIRPWGVIGGTTNAPVDTNGWPTTDCETVPMDERPFPAWAPPIDDPAGYQPDMSGVYNCSFNGQATLAITGGAVGTIANQVYNSGTNTTTFTYTQPAGPYTTAPAVIIIDFTNTKRTSTSATNTGFTNFKMIRPGYPANSAQIFTDPFINAFAPFAHLRYMGWLETNFPAGYYGDAGHHLITWSQRGLPSDASQATNQAFRVGKIGFSWEYVILLANQLNKDAWINIPISATGYNTTDTTSYIYQLALLFKNGNAFTGGHGLNPGLHLYIEHSNEVWNFGFSQYTWNKLEAADAVAGTGSLGTTRVNSDNINDQEVWAHRRHAERLYQIAQIFATVFGAGSLNTTIRPVYASWTNSTQPHYADVLSWMNTQYGAPSGYFWAIAGTSYCGETPTAGESVATILANMTAASNANLTFTQQLRTIANTYGLKLYAYEAGPDNGGGDVTNVGNRILANRDPGMTTLIEHDVRTNYFGQGLADSYNYFALSSGYSRNGCWGASDDITKTGTDQVKWAAIYNLTGYNPGGPPPAPTGLTATAGNTQVALAWNASSGATAYDAKRSTTSGSGYVTISSPATTSFTNTGLTNGTTYYFVVDAKNANGTSGNSSQASATPTAGGGVPPVPTGLAATPGNAQVALSWNTSTGATAYDVKRSTVSGSGYVTVSSPAATSYTNTGLTNGITYYFVVDAKNASGTSANSAQVSATPSAGGGTLLSQGMPATASSFQGTGFEAALAVDGNTTTRWSSNTLGAPYWIYVDLGATKTVTRVLLNWEGAYGKDYTIQTSPDASAWTTIQTVTGNATAGVHDYTGLSGSGRYVRVNCTAVGPWPNISLYEFQVYGSAGGSPPPAPTNLTATPGNGQVVLNWTASAGATSYTVNFTTGGNYTVAGNPTGTTFTHTGLTNGTLYTYYVTASNANGTSGASNGASATPSGTSSLLSQGKPTTASSTAGGFSTASVDDGNLATRWASNAGDPQWIYIDLGVTKSVTEVKLTWEAAYASSYQIQTSPDAINWTTIYSTTTGTGGTNDLTGLSGSGRYIRMNGTVRGQQQFSDYSLWEMQVYGF